MTDQPKARNVIEMEFAASLLPCPHCQTTEQPDDFDLTGGGVYWGMTAPCPKCKQVRTHRWETEGHPIEARTSPYHLGDPRPSEIIRAGQFLAEIFRLQPLLREPVGLPVDEWYRAKRMAQRVSVCTFELLKFIPAGADRIPESSLKPEDGSIAPEHLDRAWLQAQHDRAEAHLDRFGDDMPRISALERAALPPPPVGAIDRESLLAHDRWVRAGRQGPGRLEVRGFDATGLRLGGVGFQHARLERVRFDRALLVSARMTDCELRDLSVVGANGESIQLARSTIAGGTFAGSILALAVFVDARVDKTSFEDADLDRSEWRGATVTDACFDRVLFGNTWFDGAHFKGCSFRDADMRLFTQGIKATTSGAVFEGCDLRNTRWDGRDLSGATFTRCKLHGATGRPASRANVKVEAPDLSPDGDGSRIGTLDDVIDLWRGTD